MVFGGTDAIPLTLADAAKHMGIKKQTAAHYFRHPAARAEYLRLCKDLREAEGIRNLHTAVEIRDDAALKLSAAGARARIEASRFIENSGDEGRGGIHVNVGVSVQSLPGYQVRAGSDPTAIARALARARSVSAIGGDVIDHVPAPEIEPPADDQGPRPSAPRFHFDPRQLSRS